MLALSRILGGVALLVIGLAGKTGPALAQSGPTGVAPLRSSLQSNAFDALRAAAVSRGSLPVLVTYAETPASGKQSPMEREESIREDRERLLASLPGIRERRGFRRLPVAALEVDAAGIDALRASPLVMSIQEDAIYEPLLDQSVPTIGADKAWDMGGSGVGQVVAVIDTGVDSSHPFLAGKVVAEACFSTGYASATSSFASVSLCADGTDEQIGAGAASNCDASIAGCDHGTRVAGIVAGRGELFSGVARDAELLAIQVFSRFENYCGAEPCVRSWVSDQIAALEHVYDLSDTLPIAAVNLSLGGGHYTSEESCDLLNPAMKSAIDMLAQKGIAVVAASGNSGMSDGMVAPACVSSSVSVGATSLIDGVSIFSSSASFLDLLAPGENITTSTPGGGFASGNGTSFAAPHVAGAWAILKGREPEAPIDQILANLAETGVPVLDDRNEVTTARVRVDRALESTILPVELVSFDARVHDGDVVLAWETLSEVNNAGFEVQYAAGDRFEVIGFVAGGGTRSGLKAYSHRVTTLPPGRHRFRLKQIDFDGFMTYSPEVVVRLGLDQPFHLSPSYPNPFNPQTQFTLTVATPQHVRLAVYNVIGQQIALLEDAVLDGERAYRYTFDAGELPNGLYIIRAIGETFTATKTAMLAK
ncbi:MAG: S8 family serine peptidase [Rhodothermales bacterium]|nr:S8 family serine peptidase [Rhodothermales bacterium]